MNARFARARIVPARSKLYFPPGATKVGSRADEFDPRER
jgi:hypothetical protein